MKLTKIRNVLHNVSKVLINVFAILLGVVIILGNLIYNENVESLLSQFVFKDEGGSVTVNTGKAPVRYKSWYSSVEDTLNGNGEIAWFAQAEGTVLLKNAEVTVNEKTAPALPLAAGEKVSLYGVTAYDPMYCLDGAGNNKINDPQAYDKKGQVNRRQFFYSEFSKAGLTMNSKLEQWYNSDAGKYYRRYDTIGYWGKDAGNSSTPALTEANWNVIDSAAKDYGNFGKNSTAIYITGRMTNEAMDLTQEGGGNDSKYLFSGPNNDGFKSNTDYLAFTDNEKNLLQELGKNYDKVVVIFNQANPPQEDIPALLEQYGIEAAMWIGFPGSDGIKAVAEILTGKINPSGGLSAAWYTSRNANPSTQNFAIGSQTNVVNMEGMYVGYRYAETRYEDVLLGSEKAGSYDYGANISYPFGYGLSYTSFEYSGVEIVKDDDPAKNYYTGGLMASNAENYTGNYGKLRPEGERRATGDEPGDCDDLIIKVNVTNTGSVAGKEIVQIYLKQPVTAQDTAHGVQKPAVQLVGYGKTSLLAPGASEVVEIEIDANKWFAAYDAKLESDGKTVGGYVLAEGNYYLAAARNSHEAVNSIYLASPEGTAANEHLWNEYGAGKAANVATVSVDTERSASYKYWTQGTEDDVHNLFQDVAPNTDMVFSRFDWEKTAAIQSNNRIGLDGKSTTGSANTGTYYGYGPTTPSEITAYATYFGIDFDDTAYTFGQSETEWKLVDLIGVEYDSARGASEEDVNKWKEIVGQLTRDEIVDLFSNGLRKTRAIDSIGKPPTNDQNASNGFEWAFGHQDSTGTKYSADAGFMHAFDSSAKIAYPTGYPCEGIVAASFSNYVAYLVGQAIGEDALWGGTAGIYGFGLGLQRNPYHGRTGEFYSDDSFLTGMIGGYSTLGAQLKGLYVYNKHFVLNDQDTNRGSYKAWIDEQTFRQIYLRPFEMAIEIGDAMNVMIAFNRLGNDWTGNNYNLMTRWLRGEAGMAGFAISDWYSSPGENLGVGMLAGACLLDGNLGTGANSDVNGSLGDARYDNRVVEAVTRILYTVANSNAMNMIGDTTVTYTYGPAWFASRDAIIPAVSTTVYVFFGLSCAFAIGTTVWKLLDRYVFKKED